ncbi:unnamed protein product [Chrysoparadoxa australica]
MKGLILPFMLVSGTWLANIAFAATAPIALHQVVVVDEDAKPIHLRHVDFEDDKVTARVVSEPSAGELFQLSAVYDKFGYEPRTAERLSSNQDVTSSSNTLIFQRPRVALAPYGMWGSFSFTVSDATATSLPSIVYLLSNDGVLVGSRFSISSEGWEICQQVAAPSTCQAATHDTTSRDAAMNAFITGEDRLRHIGSDGGDKSKWFFAAPTSTFSGNLGVAYQGSLEFDMASLSGDFSSSGSLGLNIVELYCERCSSNTAGTTLAFPLSATEGFSSNQHFVIPLTPSAGWIKDPENSLVEWSQPTVCEFIEVLSNLSSLRILGDLSSGHETIGIDNVAITQLRNTLPVCAQGRPDATVCIC